MIMVGALILSLGVGYELTSMDEYEKNPWKGLFQIEYVMKGYSIGFLHTSRTQDGFDGDKFDQDLIYIKRDFDL